MTSVDPTSVWLTPIAIPRLHAGMKNVLILVLVLNMPSAALETTKVIARACLDIQETPMALLVSRVSTQMFFAFNLVTYS